MDLKLGFAKLGINLHSAKLSFQIHQRIKYNYVYLLYMEQKNIKQLRLTDITRYNDVETGRLTLKVGNKQKSWKAVWLTNLRFNVRGKNLLPRTTLPLSIRANERYLDCLRLKLNRRMEMWIVPLETDQWIDFGVDLYLCSEDEEFIPLPMTAYQQLIDAINRYGIRELTVDEPRCTVDGNRLCQDNGQGFDADFWDD